MSIKPPSPAKPERLQKAVTPGWLDAFLATFIAYLPWAIPFGRDWLLLPQAWLICFLPAFAFQLIVTYLTRPHHRWPLAGGVIAIQLAYLYVLPTVSD